PSFHSAASPLRGRWTGEISGRAKNESRLGSESRLKYRKRFSHTPRSDYLPFSSGTAILWEVIGWAAFSVWRSRQLDIRRWASSIWTAVIRDPMTLNRSLSFPRNPVAIVAHVYA